ncbi:hypothetical protein U2F26_35395 [Micromonospora sp. 4G57]|uniref:Zinc ribbon domain-containing protein n=1 Tax=Micromonospora sicca TaxID=2202420 RepID=A0ABU5JQN6_9ACTN|nr:MULTISPECIES: hypothetical protein [unclassified Micromonospora]MDZ5447919.1 hypothetical protein [Micromonospora sp. 4G57]MDZ5494629.1 hypothetical protein [Micromonospora sp. 4G53]
MMTLYTLRCPGCEEPFSVRLGIGPSKMTRFYVPCAHCRLPIRGRSHGKDLESHRVEFEAESLPSETSLEAAFVTVDPNVPSKYNATQRGELGTFPTMTLIHLVGAGRGEALFEVLSRGRTAVEELWPQVRRIYEYYLVEDWKHFDKAGKAAFNDWRTVSTTHERATMAHQAVGIAAAAITDDIDDSAGRYLHRVLAKHTSALRFSTYIHSARADVASGLVPGLQRSVFDVIDRFIGHFDAWQMGVLRRVMPPDRLPLLRELTLFRDEFDVLRDLYQQGFETVCKTLRFAVAAQNTVKRQSPGDFGIDLPAGANLKANPKSLNAYDKLANAARLAFVRQVPGWEGYGALLNNRTRNAIGHATARHDLRTGRIFSDKEPDGVQ